MTPREGIALAASIVGSDQRLSEITGFSLYALYRAKTHNRAPSLLAIKIEEATNGMVKREILCPSLSALAYKRGHKRDRMRC